MGKISYITTNLTILFSYFKVKFTFFLKYKIQMIFHITNFYIFLLFIKYHFTSNNRLQNLCPQQFFTCHRHNILV
jgi:hypothetical protein